MMSKITVILVLLFLFACKKENTIEEDPCERVVNGEYQYPEVPANHGWSKEKVYEYLNLPVNALGCLDNKGLIKACLDYHQLGLIFAYNSVQQGYSVVRNKFRGFEELEKRENITTSLLDYYKSFEPIILGENWNNAEIGSYLMNIMYFEIILSQNSLLEKFQNQELINLIEYAVNYYYFRVNDEIIQFAGAEGSLYIVSRLMNLKNYGPFLNLYESNDYVKSIVGSLEFNGSLETADTIILLAKDYLVNIKN